MMTPDQIQFLATKSCDIIVNSNEFTIEELKTLAMRITYGQLIIKKAYKLSFLDAHSIASVNPGKETFDFTK